MSESSTIPDKKISVGNSTQRKQVGFWENVRLQQNKTVPMQAQATSSQSNFSTRVVAPARLSQIAFIKDKCSIE